MSFPCPNCQSDSVDVRDSRPCEHQGRPSIRRRRHCRKCRHRFTTFEIIDRAGPASEASRILAIKRVATNLQRAVNDLSDLYDQIQPAEQPQREAAE